MLTEDAGLDALSPESTPADCLPTDVWDRVVYDPHLGGITSFTFLRSPARMCASVRFMLEGGHPHNVVNWLSSATLKHRVRTPG
ncbi:MAG: hypothetical protein KH028_09355 [Oscillospiraceae bacterium]|jgi:lactate dehydrogenase-like 2-hydroxyacid dehydrogenase|nr:hypothetical protein [Oscillospiraceae bacterium]